MLNGGRDGDVPFQLPALPRRRQFLLRPPALRAPAEYGDVDSSIGSSLSFSSSSSDVDSLTVDDDREGLALPSSCDLGIVLNSVAKGLLSIFTRHPPSCSMIESSPASGSSRRINLIRALPDCELERCLLCPVTCEIMKDPVMDPDGHSYERSSILRWIAQNGRSPITRKRLDARDLRPNRALKAVIQQYTKKKQRFSA